MAQVSTCSRTCFWLKHSRVVNATNIGDNNDPQNVCQIPSSGRDGNRGPSLKPPTRLAARTA